MGHKLADLNSHLFNQLDRLSNDQLSAEEVEIEAKRASAIVDVADKIIDNARIVLAGCQLVAKHGDRFLDQLPMLNGPKRGGSDQ